MNTLRFPLLALILMFGLALLPACSENAAVAPGYDTFTAVIDGGGTYKSAAPKDDDEIADNNGVLPVAFTYQSAEVQSRQQMALRMGVNVETLTSDVNARLGINNDETYSSFTATGPSSTADACRSTCGWAGPAAIPLGTTGHSRFRREPAHLSLRRDRETIPCGSSLSYWIGR